MLLRLLSGTMHAFYQKDASYHLTQFSVYDITLDLTATLNRAATGEGRQRDDHSRAASGHGCQAVGRPADVRRAGRTAAEVLDPLCLAGIRGGGGPTRDPPDPRCALARSDAQPGDHLCLLPAPDAGRQPGQPGAVPAWVAMWLPNALLSTLALGLSCRRPVGPPRWAGVSPPTGSHVCVGAPPLRRGRDPSNA